MCVCHRRFSSINIPRYLRVWLAISQWWYHAPIIKWQMYWRICKKCWNKWYFLRGWTYSNLCFQVKFSKWTVCAALEVGLATSCSQLLKFPLLVGSSRLQLCAYVTFSATTVETFPAVQAFCHLWPYLGKAGLTKIALKRFSVVMHFQRIVNALKSISNAFWNIANAFQRKRNALRIHLKSIFKTLSMRWQTLTMHLKKLPQAVWNHSRHRCY